MKTKLSVLLLGFFLFFTFAQGAGEKVDSKKIAEGLQKAINNHDATMMAKLYTEDAILVMSGEPEPIRGRKAIEKNHVALFRAFPDMKIEFTLVLESGNYIVFEQIVRGTHKGPFPTPAGDLPATGRNTKPSQEEENPDELRHGMIPRRYFHDLPSLYRRVTPRSQAGLDRFDRGPFPGINNPMGGD